MRRKEEEGKEKGNREKYKKASSEVEKLGGSRRRRGWTVIGSSSGSPILLFFIFFDPLSLTVSSTTITFTCRSPSSFPSFPFSVASIKIYKIYSVISTSTPRSRLSYYIASPTFCIAILRSLSCIRSFTFEPHLLLYFFIRVFYYCACQSSVVYSVSHGCSGSP